MFHAQHCKRRQTKESLCRVLFPSERNRLARAVIYTAEFDNSTNGWHGQHGKCVESSLFVNLFPSREKAVCKHLLQIFTNKIHTIFEENSFVFYFSQ